MESINKAKVIDVDLIVKIVLRKKRFIIINLTIVFFVSCIIILSVPRYYTCEVKLAPETSNMPSGGSLNSLASSFGLDIASKLSNDDAISPELYPDLMKSTNFMVSLFPIKIITKDGKIHTNYYDYLKSYQKYPWWNYGLLFIKNIFSTDSVSSFKGNDSVNPFLLSKMQTDMVNFMEGNISCKVDKKTNVISITVEDQDPLVCATIADSVRVRLQLFITNYRTNKARNDLNFSQKLYNDSKREYERSRQLYAAYSDANQNIVLESFISKKEDLENDMQLKFNAYSTIVNQLQAAKAKVQERTPAFTVLQCASVPIKPAGPKRMLFVAVLLVLTFIGSSTFVVTKTYSNFSSR